METIGTLTAQNSGTTLEILAPFLPYGIEVEYPLVNNPYGDTMRRRLVGLNSDSGIATLSNETTIWAPHCVPILRPFSQLCDPLPDGTVPAIEVAKMAVLGFTRWGAPVARFSGDTLRVDFGGHEDVTYIMGCSMDGGFWIDDAGNTRVVRNLFGILAYLRKHHFAVGLEPHQFIEKQAEGAPTKERSRDE